MNQQCKVCGEPAAGFHFGAFTCEGCKSFFGRSYNNLGSITECKNQGSCVINKKNRTSCKACRLRKCLLVGMSKSGSRYGRRSNWFKIHCLLQEQQQQQQQQAGQQSSPGSGHKSPPPQLGMLGPHALHQVLSRASTKEDLLMLGMVDEYKHSEHAASSPSGSSPESHNSDTSVEVGDGRLGGHRGHHPGHGLSHGLSHGLGGLGGLGGALPPFPARPSPLQHAAGPPQHPPPPPHPTAKELLLPLSLQSLPFMMPHPAFLQPHCPPFMFPPGVLPRAFNNNTTPFNNNNNNNEDTLEYSKRFYLDSILHAPRPHYRDHGDDGDASDGAEEAKAPRRRPSSPPRPKIALPAPVDDHPMDLSVRGGGGSATSNRDADVCSVASGGDDAEAPRRRPSSDAGGMADDDRSLSGASENGDREDEDEDVDVEVTRAPERTLRVIPLDLSART